LKSLAQHFVDCIRTGAKPLTSGVEGLELVRVLEAASASLRANGAPIPFSRVQTSTRSALAHDSADTHSALDPNSSVLPAAV
ncbi:MAG: hypothetical protein ACR2IV_08530, partial [Bryobacteraceae bacterium]